MILGNIGDNFEDDWAEGYKIYLHEKGQFWPGLEKEFLGLDNSIFLKLNKELRGSFNMKEKILLNKPSSPCIEDPSYSYTQCMFQFVANMAGCHLDWVTSLSEEHPRCTSTEQVLTYNENLFFALTTPWMKLAEKSGCHAKCKYKEFIFTEISEESATWKHNWSSSFFLVAEKTLIKYEEELLAFDISDTLNGIGGAMGLFLGWSVLYIVSQCSSAIWLCMKSFFMKITNKEKSQLDNIDHHQQ